MRCGIDQAMESFVSDLRSLRADTLTGARTAFIGKLMEATYHAANMEHGKPRFQFDLNIKVLLTVVPRPKQSFQTHAQDHR
jgi:uncharacterized protein (DUF2252 family)